MNQTIQTDTNQLYQILLATSKGLTSCSIIVKTSFDVRGQPIVCKLEDALKCLTGTEVEWLVCGNSRLSKEVKNTALTCEKRNHYEVS